MKNYQELMAAIAGSRGTRLLRALFTVYQLADFCCGARDLPVPFAADLRTQVEGLFPDHPLAPLGESAGFDSKNHACSHARYRGCGPAYSTNHSRSPGF
jgi:hypothetical protein